MEGFNEKEGQLYVDDLPISEIADKYSTPAFIYSAYLPLVKITRGASAEDGNKPRGWPE